MKISHILQESPQLCPECGGPAFGDLLLAEKKDACYSKVRSRYKVWPSAYASGALVQCRKKGAANWGNKNESEDDNFGKPAALMTASPEALKTAQDIVQKQADKNVISQAKIAGAVPYQGVAEGLGKDLKRLATGKDVKSRAGQEIAKSQQASMTGDNKTAHKHFKRYDKLDKLANKGVAEGSLNEVTQGVEHSEWADNVKNAYYPTAVRIVKKRTEDGRHIKSQAIANGKLVGQYNMNTGVGTFTNPKKKGMAEGLGLRNLRNTLSGIPKTRYAQDQARTNSRRPTPQELDRRKQAEKDKKPGAVESKEEKIAGRHDPEEFDAMVGRLKQLAGSGPLKTVWDEKKRVYRNVPTAQQPNKGSQSNA
jgi:ribosomal protein S20